MLSQSVPKISPGQLFDETSNSKLKVQNGHIIVEHLDSGKISKHPLPPLKFKDDKTSFASPLKFVSKNANVTLNSTGNVLTCKSLTFQQVEMNKNFSKEITYWQLYIPQKTPLFSVGIQSKEPKSLYVFDFCINRPTILTFKLDLEKKTFTCWFNGVQSEFHKPIQIQIDAAWTPFVRVKSAGTNIILNSLTTDPENFIVSYFNSGLEEKLSVFTEPLVENIESSFVINNGHYTLHKISVDKILLVGENSLKVLSRSANKSQFDFGFAQLSQEDKVVVSFKEKEFSLLIELSKKLNISLLTPNLSKKEKQEFLISTSKEEWRKWASQVLRYLNQLQKEIVETLKQNRSPLLSIEEIHIAVKIVLQKIEMVNPWLNSNDRINSLYSQFNQLYNNVQLLPYFEEVSNSFKIPKQITLNNLPFIKFNSSIVSVKSTENSFIGCLMNQGNRISIINAQAIPFKVIETVLSRGFAKEAEINQYKKQIEDIQDSDFTKPHIFKILKNCLKYADKIKPPAKLIQEIEKKKQAIEQKKAIKEEKPQTKKPQEDIDKSLLNTLVMMGFGQKPSKKALIQCKNQSLEAAIDLILNKYKDEKDPVVSTKPTREWQCKMCTLINPKNAVICSACENPAPVETEFEQIEILSEKKEDQKQKEEEQKEQQIVSKSIEDQTIKQFYIWNTQVVYCPILIAAVFDTKIRFRLLGPNPKFYSSFYTKDNSYFDLSTLKSHQYAHQIDQQQISHMFYLTSSVEEQKRANWGWMNIEDWDFNNVELKQVSLIQLKHQKTSIKDHKFSVSINYGNECHNLNCRIVLDNVYEEKKRCFVVNEVNISESEKAVEPQNNVLQRKSSFVDDSTLVLSQNSHVVCDFALSGSEKTEQILKSLVSLQTEPQPKPSLPTTRLETISLVAVSGSYNSQLRYPGFSTESLSPAVFNHTNPFRNGVVFEHPHGKTIKVSQVKLQEKKKVSANKAGYLYLIDDLSKEPLFKHEFEFSDNTGKTIVEMNNEKGKYLVVVLHPQEHQSKVQLSNIAVYGEVLDNLDSCTSLRLNFLEGLVRVNFQNEELNQKPLKELVKLNIEIVNYPIDLSVSNQEKALKTIKNLIESGTPINLRVKLTLKQRPPTITSTIRINSIILSHLTPLTSLTQHTTQTSLSLTEEQFISCLQSFIQTGETQYFDIIRKEENKEFRGLVSDVDLSAFVEKLVACTNDDKREKINFRVFVEVFGQHLRNNSTIKAVDLIEMAFKSEKLTASGIQLCFLLVKTLGGVQLSKYFALIETQLNEITSKKQSLNLQSAKNLTQSYTHEKSLFSDIFHRLSSKGKASQSDQSQIHYHYICQKNINTRKYTVDMMSLYSLNKLELKFEHSSQKSMMLLELSYIDQNGGEKSIGRHFYPENVWTQLMSKSKTANSLIFNLKNVNSRYLIINCSFSPVPYAYHKRLEDSIPTNEIIPIVSGSYIDECEPFLKEKFEISPESLHLLKKVDHFSKFSLKQAESIFYYNSEEAAQNQKLSMQTVEELQKKDDTTVNRQALVSHLMKNPSKDSINFNFTLAYLLIDAALQTNNSRQLASLGLSQSVIERFVDHFVNNERGAIHEKAIQMLRRLITSNNKIFLEMLQARFSCEPFFAQVFKDHKVNENPQLLLLIDQVISKQSLNQNKHLVNNMSWLVRIYTFDNVLIEKFTETADETGHHEEMAGVFQKYGWTSSAKKIVSKLFEKYQVSHFIGKSPIDLITSLSLIVSSSKNNVELAEVAFEQLKLSNFSSYNFILSELSRESRHTKINQVEKIVFYLLKDISFNEDEEYKREQYLSVLSLINKFGHTAQIVNEVLQAFFKIEERNAYLNELLVCSFLKNQKQQQILLKITISQLGTSALKANDLSLVNDVLGFVLSKQVSLETQKISFVLQPDTQSVVMEYFARFLKTMLNIGGLQSVKLIDEQMTDRIKIAFNLSTLLQTNHVFTTLNEGNLENLTRWLMLNLNTSIKHIKTPNCMRFLKIQELVWKIVEAKGNSSNQLFAKIYVSVYKELRQKFSLIQNFSLKYSFSRKLDKFNILVLEKFTSSSQFLLNLLKQNALFVETLGEFTNLNTENLNEKLTNDETELVNLLCLYPDSKDKPKDWLLYKNGSKNHVYKIEYSKTTQQVFDLTLFAESDLFTLSKVIFGFKHDLTAEKNVCLPKEIRVEGGASLNKMRFIGQMFEIRDDRYINYSVKLFGLNTNILKSSQNIQVQCNKNLPIKYLRFKIRSPEPVSIEDALSTENSEQKNSLSLINFLSVQGQRQKSAQPYTDELVRYLQLLTRAEHKELINALFNEKSVVEAFKSALLKISFLMKIEKYEKTLHNFLMRICQQNTLIGNQMIEKYLQLENSDLCAKISAEIVLSNDQQIPSRSQTYFEFICKVVLENKYFSEDVVTFLNRFTQIAFYATTRNKYQHNSEVSEIKLSINPLIITALLDQIQSRAISSQSLLIIAKFLRTIITLSAPFVIEGIELKQVLGQLYQRKNKLYDDILGALIIDNKECRSWFMENKCFENVFQETFNLIKTTQQSSRINANLEFLTTLSSNANIKQLINKYQYNLRLFEMLMSKNYQTVLSKPENDLLRKNFVQLIAKTSLGSENQTIIASLLKDSIPNIISEGNEKFVGQIFLPLLNSYEKILLCVLPYSQTENKLLTDITNTDVNLTSSQLKSNAIQDIAKESSFRLPSTLTSESLKEKLFEQLKKSSYHNGNFNLAMNHGTYTTGLGETFQNKVMNNSLPFMIILRLKTASQQSWSHTICIFCNRTKKLQQNQRSAEWQKGSFVLYAGDSSKGKQVIVDTEPTVSKEFVLLNTQNIDDDSESNQDEVFVLDFKYNNKVFGEINFTYNDSNYFVFQNLSQEMSIVDSYLQSAEYWSFTTSTVSSSKPIHVAQEQSQASSLTKSLLSSNYDHTLFNSHHLASSSINSLRYEKVYEFPSSITVSQLKESLRIVNCSLDENKLQSLNLSLLGNKDNLSEEMTLEEIRKKSGKKDLLLLDVNMNFDNLLSLMNLKDQSKKQQVDFLPRKGILKYFEENEGIQSMIKVIKKSIEGWKNKVRMEKWLQYVTELENFSQFPHFFAIYLKDKQTFDLLFNLLAGLPDKQTDNKWDELESSSSQKLLRIVSQILHMDKTSQFRQYALKNNFFITILQRLRLLTGIFKRKYDKDYKEDDQQLSPNKNPVDDDGTKKIKKKKGVGYGNDQSSNTKWMKGDNMEAKKKEFQVVEIILNIIENFLDIRTWKIPESLLGDIYESALLPFIEDGLRAGTLLQISKHPQKFKVIFKIINTFSKHERLVPALLPISNNYQPRQTESIESLLKSLENIASIFLSCLNTNKTTQTKEEQASEELANLIKQTYFQVEDAIEDYKESHMNDDNQEKQLEEILELSLDKKYRTLMKDLRFDYIDMKQGPNKIKHHYASNFNPNYTPNQNKMIRLAQELADISTALPFEHTNAIYVRCDKDRVDFMQALIIGANGTPYGHGAYLFDVYFDDNYPNNPPKVNLTTTGHGKVRFNPNLYACGKVCLSLLGTWRGSASQNWDAKVSTLLQVLLSIQAIIMSEQVYFNEPGFQNEQGTQEGEKKNQAYSNIVRYCNIKFAMTDNIKNPPKGFETVIRRHFYLKKEEIMEECRKWQKYAQKRNANYIGLVNDHNHSWSNEFKKTKTTYKEMLDIAIKQLEDELNKLQPPKITDIMTTKQVKKQKKKKVQGNKMEELQKEDQEQIDVSYDKNKIEQAKQIDITDEKVKDRWSRYIGAMGIDAVSKQSKADILVFGLNPLGLQTVKNIVLSGCRKLTICDDGIVQPEDLSGGFFYTHEDIGKKRTEAILYKVRQLNVYVKIDAIEFKKITPDVLKTYSIVLAIQISLIEQRMIAETCREHKVKFISADSIGFTCRIINDLGEKFEVLDKNGEEPIEVFVKEITNAEKGVVTLLDGVKNPFEDGQAVLIRNVQGMKLKDEEGKSINDTIHKVKVINSKSFQIGNTLNYSPYVRNGTIKNIKTPVELSYKPFSEVVMDGKNPIVDENLAFYDFSKFENSKLIKCCYLTLEEFRKNNQNKYPEAWNAKDMNSFVEIFKKVYAEEVDEKTLKFIQKFALTCKGYLPPLCAFFGGMVCQQVIKAITQKFKPIHSEFYIQFSEVVPEIPAEVNQQALNKIYTKKGTRDVGFESVIGSDLLQVIKDSKLFMIGSGAIGCQLLKNFAMIGFGTGQKGKITLTDPDHIENSNLNRQFLFREKHISKSKSRTASQAVKLMNPALKNHISALNERVSDSTKDIFTNKFFEGLTLVANALDNVAARRYVDQRCVQNKVPLFESGTLGPKGHVQVIIPYLTESYGSQNDPVEEGQIPHCTLKMFPEETLHCVEWARDIFGKKFSLQPKALMKIIDKTYKPQKDDTKTLNESLTMVKKGPKTFEDCINYAIHKFYKYFRDDVMQLLYTYPLDAKTKNGEPFWKLPKRPPTPIIQFDPENVLQSTFVASLAVMTAKIYQIDYPKNFRTETQRLHIAKVASKVKIHEFVPSDQKAKQILKQSTQKKQENVQEQKTEQVMQEKDENELYKDIIITGGHQFKIKSEEFEKDDDANGHIDFIYSMANLRAINYKLDSMDWINVKIKAGRIVPALATTTACVSGLQTLEICKYLKKIKIDLMKNSYLNLAVPSIQMSEPGEVLKKKITQNLTVNLWDRWEVQCQKSTTFGDLYEKLAKKYEIFPIGILQGMSRIDTGKSEEAKKAFLKEKILDKLDLEESYIDIIVLFTKSPQDEKIIEGVPPVRLHFV